jgi:oligopeptidase B
MAKRTLSPPVARTAPERRVIHGVELSDPYAWLKSREDPEVAAYLEAENEYTQGVMSHTEEFQEALYQELLGRIKETDTSAPERKGDHFYYSRTEEGRQYPIYCRKRGSLDAQEEILLDQNLLAEGHEQLRLGAFEVSPNHALLAYSTDITGAEQHTLFVKDLETGDLLGDEIPGTHYSVFWANDNRTIFYSTCDKAQRPYRLHRHVLGTDPGEDVIVFEEPDEAFYLSAEKTRSERYFLLQVGSLVTDEWHYLDADDPMGEFSVIEGRRKGIEYGVEHQGDRFLVWTNDGAKNFKVMEAPCADPGAENWRELVPHRPEIKVESVSAFRNHLVFLERERGLPNLRIQNTTNDDLHYVEFPEPAYVVTPGENPEFESRVFRFDYQSLVTPESAIDYDMDSRDQVVVKRQEVLGGYEPEDYESERLFAKSHDGAEVPISIVHRKGFRKDGSQPLWLYGYGSYGTSLDASFVSTRLSLLDRGFSFAIAHVRGGGEMGEEWRDQGKLFNKMNTFHDFVACAEHLIAERYTSKERLVINGGSAGGLLVGAVTNMRPALFKVVVAQVPFVDVINTILDPELLFSVLEYEEWGDPNQKEAFEYIRGYTPYENVEAKEYPHILAIAGLNDPRVNFWEPAKWVAKLRAMKTDDNRLLLKTKMVAGHSGASGRYDRLRDDAFKYAFVFDVLGITE